MTSPVGLIAGSGSLPCIVTRRLHEKGEKVFVCNVTRRSNGTLKELSDEFISVTPADFGSIPKMLKKNNVHRVLMVGDVDKTQLYDGEELDRADETVRGELSRLNEKGDQQIIKAAARLLRLKGLKVIGVDQVLDDLITPAGHLAGPEPSGEVLATLDVLENVAVKLADEEVGQAVIGKQQSVVAVEAVEGTDELIRRGGALAGEGCVMLKMARTSQDTRFDVPVVGLDTLKELKKINASLLALEAGKTLWLQREECCSLADEAEISIVGWQRKNMGWRSFLKWFGE